MELVSLKTRKMEADEQIVKALEDLLSQAKEGKVHHLLVIGIDEHSKLSHNIRHRCCYADMIGVLSCMLAKIQSEWNS